MHSTYQRRWRDAPISGKEVEWRVSVRRFRCRNHTCQRKTFSEQFGEIIKKNGQCTGRFIHQIRHISYSCSAEAGARLANKPGFPISGDTLLRILRTTPKNRGIPGTIIGIDDWSYKRGLRFGTIIVDLQTRKPVELLPDRTARTVRNWLKCYPNIRIVSRDRSREFRKGIDQGALQAQQIADRWHILHNYQETVGKQLRKYTELLKQASIQMSSNLSHQVPEKEPSPNHDYRKALFLEVKQLQNEGMGYRKIAKITGMSLSTVKRYLLREELPNWKNRKPKATNLTPHETFLKQRWNAGCHNARILHEKLGTRGYSGSYASVRRYVRLYLRNNPRKVYEPVIRQFRSPKQVAFLMIKKKSKLKTDEKRFLELLAAMDSDMRDLYILSQTLMGLFQERDVTKLNPWMVAASTSQFPYLKRFVKGLKADYSAVRASLSFDWSNGQTEGQVNRLKFIKRQMYGRAKFDLLRLKVLHPA